MSKSGGKIHVDRVGLKSGFKGVESLFVTGLVKIKQDLVDNLVTAMHYMYVN